MTTKTKTRFAIFCVFELVKHQIIQDVWSESFSNLPNVMCCSTVLIMAAVVVAVAMVAVVGVVVVVIRRGTIIMHDRVALVLARTQMQQQVRTVNKNCPLLI